MSPMTVTDMAARLSFIGVGLLEMPTYYVVQGPNSLVLQQNGTWGLISDKPAQFAKAGNTALVIAEQAIHTAWTYIDNLMEAMAEQPLPR